MARKKKLNMTQEVINKYPESLRQSCGNGSGSCISSESGSQGFDDQKLKEKNTNEKFF
jgi:hypothetical protein